MIAAPAWDVIYPPGTATPLHRRHDRDFVGVELVAATVQITDSAGVHIVELPRGAMYMRRKGTVHVELAPVGKPQRNSMIVELKDGPSPGYAVPAGAPAAGFAAQGARVTPPTMARRLTIWDASWGSGRASEALLRITHDLFLIPIDPGVLAIASDDQPAKSFRRWQAGRCCSCPAGTGLRSRGRTAWSAQRP